MFQDRPGTFSLDQLAGWRQRWKRRRQPLGQLAGQGAARVKLLGSSQLAQHWPLSAAVTELLGHQPAAPLPYLYQGAIVCAVAVLAYAGMPAPDWS